MNKTDLYSTYADLIDCNDCRTYEREIDRYRKDLEDARKELDALRNELYITRTRSVHCDHYLQAGDKNGSTSTCVSCGVIFNNRSGAIGGPNNG